MVCGVLPFAIADGPENMARDEVLLEAAAKGSASLRFYGWSEPTVSLGYFQKEALRHDHPLLAGLPYVRRPTGGATLVHHYEVTYALALPAERPWQTDQSWLLRMHKIVANALRELGVGCALQPGREEKPDAGLLCFHQFTCGDVMIRSRKIVGSAQRRQRGALLQHGAILLAQSPHAPTLPGVTELTGLRLAVEEVCAAVVHVFKEEAGLILEDRSFTLSQNERAREVARAKYSQGRWNRKR
jgi:lipoate-protein ligase A